MLAKQSILLPGFSLSMNAIGTIVKDIDTNLF